VTVGKAWTDNHGSNSVFRSYGLGTDGRPRSVVSVNWLGWLLFFLYLVLPQSRYGATAGMVLLSIQVMNVASPSSVGIPPVKAAIRVLLFCVGLIPVSAYLIWQVLTLQAISNKSREMAGATSSMPILLTTALLLSGAFYVWVLIDIVRRRDPVYDRIAKTAVVLRALSAPARDPGAGNA
jgi:RDD family